MPDLNAVDASAIVATSVRFFDERRIVAANESGRITPPGVHFQPLAAGAHHAHPSVPGDVCHDSRRDGRVFIDWCRTQSFVNTGACSTARSGRRRLRSAPACRRRSLSRALRLRFRRRRFDRSVRRRFGQHFGRSLWRCRPGGWFRLRGQWWISRRWRVVGSRPRILDVVKAWPLRSFGSFRRFLHPRRRLIG